MKTKEMNEMQLLAYTIEKSCIDLPKFLREIKMSEKEFCEKINSNSFNDLDRKFLYATLERISKRTRKNTEKLWDFFVDSIH